MKQIKGFIGQTNPPDKMGSLFYYEWHQHRSCNRLLRDLGIKKPLQSAHSHKISSTDLLGKQNMNMADKAKL
jgi:hypothetical protein